MTLCGVLVFDGYLLKLRTWEPGETLIFPLHMVCYPPPQWLALTDGRGINILPPIRMEVRSKKIMSPPWPSSLPPLINHSPLGSGQYPLRPSGVPFGSEKIVGARVCGEGEGVELDVGVRPRGDNYSTSRGENYARMVELGTKGEPPGAAYFERCLNCDLWVCTLACILQWNLQ